jgi:hypothetical protein
VEAKNTLDLYQLWIDFLKVLCLYRDDGVVVELFDGATAGLLGQLLQ